jgi:hypothetical protein
MLDGGMACSRGRQRVWKRTRFLQLDEIVQDGDDAPEAGYSVPAVRDVLGRHWLHHRDIRHIC